MEDGKEVDVERRKPDERERMSRRERTFCPLAAAEAIPLSHNDTIITEQGPEEDSHCPLSLHSGKISNYSCSTSVVTSSGSSACFL